MCKARDLACDLCVIASLKLLNHACQPCYDMHIWLEFVQSEMPPAIASIVAASATRIKISGAPACTTCASSMARLADQS